MALFLKTTIKYPLFSEIILIEKPQSYCPSLVSVRPAVVSTEEEKKGNALQRARRNMRRSILANQDGTPCTLITCTFDKMVSIKYAWRSNTLFFQRLRRLDNSLRYISVLELQKSGRPHFHTLVFSSLVARGVSRERKKRTFAKVWAQGFLDMKKTDNSPKLAGYLSKYLSKSELPLGVRRFSVSRNALVPVFDRELLPTSEWYGMLASLGVPAWCAPPSAVLGEVIGYQI